MALRLGFIGIVTRDMSASLAFYRLLGAPVPEGSDEPHVDTRLEDGTVLAWDTIDLIRSLDPGSLFSGRLRAFLGNDIMMARSHEV